MNIDTDAIRRLRDHLLAHHDRQETDATVDSAGERQKEAVLRRADPFAETMYLVMIADGKPADVERKALIAAIGILTNSTLGSQDIESMFARFDANADRNGAEARLAQIGSRVCVDPDDRETAFSLAAVVALADEEVLAHENQALGWIRQYFGISQHRAASILGSL